VRSLTICTPHQILFGSSNHQIKKHEICGACSTYEERRDLYWDWRRNLRERDHLEDPGIDRKIILRWNFKKLV
jgi:hypothetical protein